jgi:hypothetical protein
LVLVDNLPYTQPWHLMRLLLHLIRASWCVLLLWMQLVLLLMLLLMLVLVLVHLLLILLLILLVRHCFLLVIVIPESTSRSRAQKRSERLPVATRDRSGHIATGSAAVCHIVHCFLRRGRDAGFRCAFTALYTPSAGRTPRERRWGGGAVCARTAPPASPTD